MNISFFLRGLIIGFSIAAPVGPIGLLCIRRTLSNGALIGFISGLGAACADAIYGSIAAFGLQAISDILIHQQIWFRIFGGFFLCYLGIKSFFSNPAKRPASVEGSGIPGVFLSTFFLTITNPMTIFSFAAIFAGLGFVSAQANTLTSVLMVLGVFTGSALWWFFLSGGVGYIRNKFNPVWMKWINQVSGVMILVFGLVAIRSVLMG